MEAVAIALLIFMAALLITCASLLWATVALLRWIISGFRETGRVLNLAIKTGTLRVFIYKVFGGGVVALSATLLMLVLVSQYCSKDPAWFPFLEHIDGFWVLCLPCLFCGILILWHAFDRDLGARNHLSRRSSGARRSPKNFSI